MSYRAEIDGLRAIAVLSVIFYHFKVPFFYGGFIGVDIFFVISGFLITKIIASEIANGTFSIMKFYMRRARRILPVLFLILVFCFIVSWFITPPEYISDVTNSIGATIVFLSNFHFYLNSGYFDVAEDLNPLIHTWSLAVEEQFYLLLPLLGLWALRKNQQVFLYTLLLLALTSFIWGIISSHIYPLNAFFLLPSRFWELATGSLCAFIVNKKPNLEHKGLDLLGISLILLALFSIDRDTLWPGYMALLPVMGTALIILFCSPRSMVGKVLSTRIFVGIGLLSYSAYLWHQPLIAYTRVYIGEEPNAVIKLGLLAVTFLLAFATWSWIEKPFRFAKQNSNRTHFKVAIALSIFLIASGVIVSRKEMLVTDLAIKLRPYEERQVLNLSRYASQHKVYTNKTNAECHFSVKNTAEIETLDLSYCFKRHGKMRVLLGDSHGIDFSGMMAIKFPNEFLVAITNGGCRIWPDGNKCGYPEIKSWLYENAPSISQVFYHQAAFHLLSLPDGKPSQRETLLLSSDSSPFPKQINNLEAIEAVAIYLDEINEWIPTTWVGHRIEPHFSQYVMLKRGCEGDFSLRDGQEATYKDLEDEIQEVLNQHDLIYYSLIDAMNFDFRHDFMNCEELYWSDGDHLSALGELRFGKRLTDDLIRN